MDVDNNMIWYFVSCLLEFPVALDCKRLMWSSDLKLITWRDIENPMLYSNQTTTEVTFFW